MAIVFKFADVEVREREFRLVKAGEVLPVEPKTFRVLLYLLRNPQTLIAKEELLNAVWGDAAVTDSSLTRTIAQLRRLLGDDIRNPRYIETVATVGYRFLHKVEIVDDGREGSAPTHETNAVTGRNLVELTASGQIADATATSSAQTDTAKNYEGANGTPTAEKLGRRNWVPSGIALLAVAVVGTVWYLRRPLPPPRITGDYVQITHDRNLKNLAGTDGSRLYFNRGYAAQSTAQVSISGGEIAPVPVALPLPSIMDVSPDGSRLLVTSADQGHGSLWGVEMPSGSLQRLSADAWVTSAAWSADGKLVAYSAGGDLDIMQSDGTGSHRLAALGGPPDDISWSPDGNRIRFTKDNQIWEITTAGSGPHALLPGWHPTFSQCCGRWTPDGKFFVFLSGGVSFDLNKLLPASQLWILDERHYLFRRTPPEPVNLTSGPIRWHDPIPSKDGTKIFAQGVILRGELVRFDAQSNGLQTYLGGISAEFVTFSSDDQSVAYVTFPEGILWRANRDGSQPVQLTNAPLYPLNPRWSPDGSQILFSSYDAEGKLTAYVTSSQGGEPHIVLPEDTGGQSDPNWSPDGRKIVFSTLVKTGNFNSVLRVLDLASHQVTTVPGSQGMWSPRWSPNGKYIAGIFTGPTGGLKVLDLDTQRWSVLQLKSETGWPTWSSDSKFIYYLRAQDEPGVYRARVSDGNAEMVVDLKGFRHTGALTLWMGLDPQDAPILIRDVGTADIYALTLEQK